MIIPGIHLSGVSHASIRCNRYPGAYRVPGEGQQERDTSLRSASEGVLQWLIRDPLLENSQEARMTSRIGSTKQVPSQPTICTTAVTYIENYNLTLLMMHGIYNRVISYPDPVEVLCSA